MANDTSLLHAALVGYQNQLTEIDRAVADIRKRLGGRMSGASATHAPARRTGRRPLSAAARKRIAAAQKKRWAAFHKQKQGK
jgi:hypothetical protein